MSLIVAVCSSLVAKCGSMIASGQVPSNSIISNTTSAELVSNSSSGYLTGNV